MTEKDRQRWDARYTAPGYKLIRPPNSLLTRWVKARLPGPGQARPRALELACGLGHNAMWLAEHGYFVVAVDISFEALRIARAELLRRALTGVTFVQADLDDFLLPRSAFDLAIVFRFLDRRLFPAIRASVRPGGLVIYETLNTGHLARNPDTCADHMLLPGELPGYFPGWRILEARDDPMSSALVAQKPVSTG